MATTTMLLCKQCNFENEPERVYCHNCGAKLDRSLLPPEATKREDPVIVQERVRKMVSPRRGMGLVGIKHFLYSVLIAAAVATLVLIVRTPDGVPELNKDAVMDAPAITDDMEAQQLQPISRRMTYTEDQVNAFLQYSIRGKESTASNFGVKFERVYVHLYEGSCAITTQHSLFGFPLYVTTNQTISVQNGALKSDTLGGAIGRLSVPAKVMKPLEVVFSPIWKLLDHDQKLLAKMQQVSFHRIGDKGSVEMITKQQAGH